MVRETLIGNGFHAVGTFEVLAAVVRVWKPMVARTVTFGCNKHNGLA